MRVVEMYVYAVEMNKCTCKSSYFFYSLLACDLSDSVLRTNSFRVSAANINVWKNWLPKGGCCHAAGVDDEILAMGGVES